MTRTETVAAALTLSGYDVEIEWQSRTLNCGKLTADKYEVAVDGDKRSPYITWDTRKATGHGCHGARGTISIPSVAKLEEILKVL